MQKILLPLIAAWLLTLLPAFSQEVPGLRSELAVPVEVEPPLAELDKTAGQRWVRTEVDLTGSMCPACLKELEDKLKKADGVRFVKIKREILQKPDATPEQKKFVQAVFIYDEHATEWKKLADIIKGEKYKISRAPKSP